MAKRYITQARLRATAMIVDGAEPRHGITPPQRRLRGRFMQEPSAKLEQECADGAKEAFGYFLSRLDTLGRSV